MGCIFYGATFLIEYHLAENTFAHWHVYSGQSKCQYLLNHQLNSNTGKTTLSCSHGSKRLQWPGFKLYCSVEQFILCFNIRDTNWTRTIPTIYMNTFWYVVVVLVSWSKIYTTFHKIHQHTHSFVQRIHMKKTKQKRWRYNRMCKLLHHDLIIVDKIRSVDICFLFCVCFFLVLKWKYIVNERKWKKHAVINKTWCMSRLYCYRAVYILSVENIIVVYPKHELSFRSFNVYT